MSQIVVPQLGESVVEARVARWLKQEGDRVETGEPVVELETDKIDLEVGADHAGVIASIARREGEDVKVGDVLATVEETGADDTRGGAGAPEPAARQAAAKAAAPPAAQPPAPESRATPTARRIAREHDVDLTRVQGSGPGGRVTKRDVTSALTPATARDGGTASAGEAAEVAVGDTRPAPAASGRIPSDDEDNAPAAGGHATPARPAVAAPVREPPIAPRREAPAASSDRGEERVRMSKRRLTIARRLVEAQRTAAMLTTFNEVDMSAVMALRERRKEAFRERHGVGLGIVSFFVKAAVAALRAFPQLNAEIQGEEIVLKRYYDIGVAVGAEGGLVVPVLRDADRMSFADLELAIRDFASRAANRTLTLQDLTGGSFTITNGGVFGSLLSTPILNPPQVGILGLHKIEDRAVPVGGQVAIRPMMYVALSYDHRIVDGREAVQFLVAVKELVEDPGNLLLTG